MPKAVNVTISLDKETLKIWEKLPFQDRSAAVRSWLKTINPKTGEKKPEQPMSLTKKLLTLEPSQEQPLKSGDSRGHTMRSYVSANIMIKEKLQHSRYTIQLNENRHSLLYNLPSGSPFG